jgi:hypothetical protein
VHSSLSWTQRGAKHIRKSRGDREFLHSVAAANGKNNGRYESNHRILRALKKLAYAAKLALTTRETLAPRFQDVNGFLPRAFSRLGHSKVYRPKG